MMIESGTSIEEAAAVAVAAAAVQDVSGPIRVAIVEDLPQIREGLSVLIDGTEGYSCVGTYESVEEALPGLCERQPQVLLLDIHLPGMAGSEGVKLIKEKLPGTQVLMLTVFDADEHIFTSLCNGASGYLLKKTPPTRLLEAISQAHTGGSPMTPEIARKVIRMFQLIKPTPKLEHDLTPQEVRLLRLLAEGHSYQVIADRFGISVNTVRTYIRSIYEKLHVHSKSEAVSKALRGGII